MPASSFLSYDILDPGVTGTLDGLAVGATANVTCDLGPNWQQFKDIMIFARSDQKGLGHPRVWFGDAPGATKYRLGLEISYGGATSLLSTSGLNDGDVGANAQGLFRVAGRFVRVEVTHKGTVNFGSDTMVSFVAYW